MPINSLDCDIYRWPVVCRPPLRSFCPTAGRIGDFEFIGFTDEVVDGGVGFWGCTRHATMNSALGPDSARPLSLRYRVSKKLPGGTVKTPWSEVERDNRRDPRATRRDPPRRALPLLLRPAHGRIPPATRCCGPDRVRRSDRDRRCVQPDSAELRRILGDLNGDGRPDLFTLGHRTADTARLHLNNGDGTFTDVLHQYLNFVDQDQHAASWVDFDNDGDQDILQMGGGGKIGMADPSANELFVNEGGMLVDEASARGIDYPAGRGRMSLWFDWNGDGELDVLLANLERPDGTYPSALFTSTAASSSRTMPSPASPRHGATRSRIFRISQPKRFRRWFCMGRLIQCTSIGPIPYLLLT